MYAIISQQKIVEDSFEMDTLQLKICPTIINPSRISPSMRIQKMENPPSYRSPYLERN